MSYRWYNEDKEREEGIEIVSLTHALCILIRLAWPEYFTFGQQEKRS